MASRLDPWPTTAEQLRAISWIARNNADQVDVFCDLWVKACEAGELGPDKAPPLNSPGSLWQAWKHQPNTEEAHRDAADRLAARYGFIAIDRGPSERPRFWFERLQP